MVFRSCNKNAPDYIKIKIDYYKIKYIDATFLTTDPKVY